MKLQHLFAVFPGLPEEKMSTLEVTGLFQDARKVIPGSVFVAIRGTKVDGHGFLPQAVAAGAVAVVVENKSTVPQSFSGFILEVPDTRQALDILAARYYWDPGQELFCAGVTGTNGKTSVTYLIESILNQGGHRTAVMGTINHHLGGHVFPAEGTTPDPIALQKRLKEFQELGATALAVEITSHALDQKRADSVPLNVSVFTNLTREHLDYHGTMENYFQAKQKLFLDLLERSPKAPKMAVVNIADRWGRRLRVCDGVEILTYGTKDADLRFEILELNFTSVIFRLITPWSKDKVRLPMCGTHNILNALGAVGVGVAAGIKWNLIIEGLNKFSGVPGRLQVVPDRRDRHVLVDYAHTPDALDNVIRALKDVRKNKKTDGKIIVVFGCGGDRDKGKRPLMAKSAAAADKVYLTSDNPRTEDPQAILEETRMGFTNADLSRVVTQVDREKAIFAAITEAGPHDVILIAGKGHEDYQIIGNEKRPFSDFEVARNILQRT